MFVWLEIRVRIVTTGGHWHFAVVSCCVFLAFLPSAMVLSDPLVVEDDDGRYQLVLDYRDTRDTRDTDGTYQQTIRRHFLVRLTSNAILP